MDDEARTLWDAIVAMSGAVSIMVGTVIATWVFTVPLVVWVQFDPAFWTDRRISVLTLGIDLVIIMVAAIQTRRAMKQAVDMLKAQTLSSARDEAIGAALVRLVVLVERLCEKQGIPTTVEGGSQ